MWEIPDWQIVQKRACCRRENDPAGERMTKTTVPLLMVIGLSLMLAASGCADMPRQQDGSQRNDYDTSLEELQLTEERRDARAQVNLGVMYTLGFGVPQDYAEAMKWYRLAAEQGLAGGQYNLGGMFAEGKGVSQNYVLAHMWLTLAARHGSENVVRELEFYEKKMSPTK